MSNDYNTEMDNIPHYDLEEITNRLDQLDTSIIAANGAMQILREMVMHMVSELKRQGIEIK